MRIIIKKDYEELTDWAATYIVYKINRYKPTAENPFVLGLPMGDTPKGLYQKLVEYNRKGKLSFSNVVVFCMNEFVGIDKKDSQSCMTYMNEHLFNFVDSKASNIYILDGMTKNYIQECENFEIAIRKLGGIDMFVGGVGADGHIAFNEPFSSFKSRTRIKTLTTKTIEDKAKFFDNDITKVPHTILTVGLGTIMDAKEVLVLAKGLNKSDAIKNGIEGGLNHKCPISILQNHQHCVLVCDEDSISKLSKDTVEYLKDVERNAY